MIATKNTLVSRRRAVVALAGLLVVGVIIAVWMSVPSAKKTPTRLVAASMGSVRQLISITGTIEPANEASLNFAVSGTINTVNVAVGQKVSPGEVVATLDTAPLVAQLAQAQASLASDQAKLAADQAANGTAAQITADQDAANAASEQIAIAQQAISNATLASSISGTVAAVNIVPGEQTGAGSSVASQATNSGSTSASTSPSSGTSGAAASSSSAQILVVGTGTFNVSASVGDTDVGKVKVGQQAIIIPDGATAPVRGTVSSVALLATQTSGVPTYPVTINVTGSPSGLFAGAGAQVSIVVRQLGNVLTVPSAAVHTVGSHFVVYELSNGKRVAHQVNVGLSSGKLTEVTFGLSLGDRVVLPVVKFGGSASGGFGGPFGGRGRGGLGKIAGRGGAKAGGVAGG